MSSFISDSKSVPPASTSASAQLEPSSAAACSSVSGLAYSNARILFASLLLVQSRQHSIGRERKIRHSHADRVSDGIRDRGPRRNHRRLAQADYSALVVAFAGHHSNHQLTDVTNARKLVELHV